MKLKFLGTSAGVPTKDRNVSAVALQSSRSKSWCLVDCGESTQHQILRSHLKATHLKAILITHLHGDHCYGLPGLLASMSMLGRQEPLLLAAPTEVLTWLDKTRELTQIRLSYKIEYQAIESLPSLSFENFEVEVVELLHRVPSYAYRFSEALPPPSIDKAALIRDQIPQGPLWGAIQRGETIEHQGEKIPADRYFKPSPEPQCCIIAGDNKEPERLRLASKGVDVLVHEATFCKDLADKADITGHSYAEQVAQFAESCEIKNLILSHFSPRYHAHATSGPSIDDIYNEAKAVYSGNLFLAEDLVEYRLDQKGTLERD